MMKQNVNAFHKIRLREMDREQACMAGLPAAEIPPMYFTPSLREICARTIAENFETLPNADGLRDLEEELYNLVVDQLRTDLPLEVTVPRIRSQEYWKACCEARWSTGRLSAYTGTSALEPPTKGGWKRVFLQRHLEEAFMNLDTPTPTEEQEGRLAQLSALCGPEVYALNFTHLRCHADLGDIVTRLPHLEALRVTYNVLNAAVAFRLDMIGMRQNDALGFQRILKSYPCLRVLQLPGNRIDAALVKAILVGMVRNTTLEELDLSHNLIDDDGVSALSVIMMKKDCSLRSIDLSDNQIRAEGAKLLGKALSVETTRVEKFSLRMNRFGDAGGSRFFHYLRANTVLKELNVSCNELAAETAEAISACLRSGGVRFTHLDLSGNRFAEEGGRLLFAGLERCVSISHMDCRSCNIAAGDQDAMTRLLFDRRQQLKSTAARGAEDAMAADIARLVKERVRRTHGDVVV